MPTLVVGMLLVSLGEGGSAAGKAAAADSFFAVLTCLDAAHGLTPRQLEVLRLTAGGRALTMLSH